MLRNRREVIIVLFVIALLVGGVCMITSAQRSKARKALAAYKAQLRAQGEKLTFEDAGYPFPLETNANLENFVVLANRLRAKSSIPGSIEVMPYESPGRAIVFWAGGQLKSSDPKAGASSHPSWEGLSSGC